MPATRQYLAAQPPFVSCMPAWAVSGQRSHVRDQGSEPGLAAGRAAAESYREGGKVKNRTLTNLLSWPKAKVEALAAVPKGQAPATDLCGAFEISRSLPHGHVAAVLGTIRLLGVEELISPIPSRQGDLVTSMITAAVIDGSSKLATTRGLRAETAASSLGGLLVWRPATRTPCMRRWTGCCPASRASRAHWPPAPARGHAAL
jgi:hypothetical protein